MFILLFLGVAFLNQFEGFSGSLIGLSALIGTAIGFASTQTIENMISGLYIMIFRPFHISGYVILPKLKLQGIIKGISLNYVKIIQPYGTTAIVSNRTVLGTEVINTRIEIEDESDEKGKKDDNEELDMNNVKKELFHAFKKFSSTKKSIFYIYPITFSIDVKMKQKNVNKAVKKLEAYLETEVEGVKDMNWRVVSRTRLEVLYEINVMIENAYSIFRPVSTALNQLEIYIEEFTE